MAAHYHTVEDYYILSCQWHIQPPRLYSARDPSLHQCEIERYCLPDMAVQLHTLEDCYILCWQSNNPCHQSHCSASHSNLRQYSLGKYSIKTKPRHQTQNQQKTRDSRVSVQAFSPVTQPTVLSVSMMWPVGWSLSICSVPMSAAMNRHLAVACW